MRAVALRPEPAYIDLLDDACLLMIFSLLDPLPDMFSISRTCWRFRGLAHDRRMWLTVCDESARQNHAGNCYSSLGQAVQAARPGDRIWLAPKGEHAVQDVVVSFPLILVGGGSGPEATRLLIPRGSTCGLDIRSTCKLVNLSAHSTLAPCVLHRSGMLHIENCHMEVDAQGLRHLCSPLVTVASAGKTFALAPLTSASTYPNQDGAADLSMLVARPTPKLGRSRSSLDHLAAVGRMFISDTELVGGDSAVLCKGSGVLSNVRVIYRPRGLPIFFLEVDSSKSETGCQLAAGRTLREGEDPKSLEPSGVQGEHEHLHNKSLSKIAVLMSKIGSSDELVRKLQAANGSSGVTESECF
eukprot:gene14819-20872_t